MLTVAPILLVCCRPRSSGSHLSSFFYTPTRAPRAANGVIHSTLEKVLHRPGGIKHRLIPRDIRPHSLARLAGIYPQLLGEGIARQDVSFSRGALLDGVPAVRVRLSQDISNTLSWTVGGGEDVSLPVCLVRVLDTEGDEAGHVADIYLALESARHSGFVERPAAENVPNQQHGLIDVGGGGIRDQGWAGDEALTELVFVFHT